MHKRISWMAAGLVLALSLAAATAWAFDFGTIENRVTKFTLDNGLTVLVLEDHSAPVVSCVTYANVGAVDDPKGATGLAHIFEHMAFKGTTAIGTSDYKKEQKALDAVDTAFDNWRREVLKAHLSDSALVRRYFDEMKAAQDTAGKYVVTNEFGKIVEKNGGVGLNAGTGSDQTVYFFSLPSNRVELWFLLESGRFLEPVLREFYKEVDVVKEERRMRVESNPFGKLFEEFLGVAFKAHPYGVSGIGHMSDLEMVTREEALQFFRTYYVASNLVLSVAGDVQPDQIRKLAQNYFGRLPKLPRPERIVTVEPPQIGERRVEVEDASQPVLVMGFHRPDETDPEDAALSALADYLGQGRTSILYKKLVKEMKIAVAAGAFPTLPGSKYPTLFGAYAMPSKDVTAADCEKVILEEIEKLKNTPVPEEELQGIKARAKAQLINELSSRQGLAVQLAAYETSYGDWRRLFRRLDAINALTAQDIQNMAQKYLKITNCTVGSIVTIKES